MGGGGLSVTWSLAVEEQFYLFAPMFVILFGRMAIALIPPLICICVFSRFFVSGLDSYVHTIFRMDSLLLGVLVWAVFSSKTLFQVLKRVRFLLIPIFVCFCAACGYVGYEPQLEKYKLVSVAILYAVFLILVLVHQGSSLTSLLRSKILVFFGMISYGWYLFHQPVSGLLHGWIRNGSEPSLEYPSGLIVTLASFFLSIGVSFVSFKLFESKFIAYGKRYSY